MTNRIGFYITVSVIALSALAACKADRDSEGEKDMAAIASTETSVAGPSPAPASPRKEQTAQQVDFERFPLARAPLPTFPYASFPATVHAGLRYGSDHPLYDETGVIVGDRLYMAEGRYYVLHFANEDAQLSAQDAQARYRDIVRDLGGVKVNTVSPHDPAFATLHENSQTPIEKILRLSDRERDLSYEAYLLRTPAARGWIIMMVNESTTRVVMIEEVKQPSSVTYIQQKP